MKHHKTALRVLLAIISTAFVFPLAAQQKPSWEIWVSIADKKVIVVRDGSTVREMGCSTGIPGTDDATPEGTYILNESGAKRGTWFYSEKYGEGARFWVGFIGGTYLFHSVPMDRDGNVITAEAKKIGSPASHGCIRLSVEDAQWFYETVTDGAVVHIEAEPEAMSRPNAGITTKEDVTEWLSANMQSYRQKYTLSCEIALIRLSLAIADIRDISEDEILESIPKGTDPETSFVCDDITAGRKNEDGSIHWNNYGTHAPVVAKAINGHLAGREVKTWEARELVADDAELRQLVIGDPSFRGAVVWLVGHPERWGENPPVNERGMVLGEHVRFLEPTLASNGYFRVRDPETGTLIESRSAGASRDLFSYRVVGLFAKTAAAGGGSGKISRGAPADQSRAGTMVSLGNTIRTFIAAKNDTKKLILLALLALAYGVLHALGPGHQKTLVSGYLFSEGGGLGSAIAASGIASASHALSVIGLFALLTLVGSGLGVMDVTRAGNLVTVISGALLVALSLIMVCRSVATLVAIIRGTDHGHGSCGCGHHREKETECSHTAENQPLKKRGAVPLLISGSLMPCPGAALFLLYGFHEANPLAGIVAVIAISLGMWITLLVIGVASVIIRSLSIANADRRKSAVAKFLPSLFGVCGSCAVLIIAVFTVIPG